MNPGENDRKRRVRSSSSSRKTSPLLMAKKGSPMLRTHPVVAVPASHDHNGVPHTEGPTTTSPSSSAAPVPPPPLSSSPSAAVDALRLPEATAGRRPVKAVRDEADPLDTVSVPGTGRRRRAGDDGGKNLVDDGADTTSISSHESSSDTEEEEAEVDGESAEWLADGTHTEAQTGKRVKKRQKRRRLEKKKQGKAGDLRPCHASSCSASATKAADPAVVRDELQRLSSLFSRVEFQLDMSKAPMQQRTALYPRDVGSLLLWAVPAPIPLIEAPRVFMIKNKSRLRDCVVIYVNGWSYDMMMCTGVGVKHEPMAGSGRPEEAVPHQSISAAEEDEKEDEVWNERICSALLQPIRQNTCWARQATYGGVQYAPLFIPNMKNTMEQEIFWRNDAPRTPRDGGGSRRQQQQPLDSDVVDESRVNTPQEEAKGVGAALRRAKEIVSSSASSSPVTAQPPPSDAVMQDGKDTGTTAATGRAPQPLWGDTDLLAQYALRLPEHRAAFEDLGFTLSIPRVDLTAAAAAAAETDAEEREAGEKGGRRERPVGVACARGPDSEWDRFDPPPAAAATTGVAGVAAGGEEDSTAQRRRNPKVFAFDCEMVLTGQRESQLARATLINVRTGEVAFDMLVKPREPVTNYLTRFSGIDEDMLRDVSTTLQDCQRALKKYVDAETFVVGHSLENDFKACKMLPNCYVLDSAWLYPHPSGLPYKNSLKFLTMRYLGRKIQQGSHDSSVDALASADLVHLKMERGPQFGVRERVSVLGLMVSTTTTTTTTDAGTAAKDGRQGCPVSVQLFDDAQVLTTLMPADRRNKPRSNAGQVHDGDGGAAASSTQINYGAINAVPVRHDEDATRKVVRALEKRHRPSAAEATQDGFSLMWVQLTETRDVDVVMRVPKTVAAAKNKATTATSCELEQTGQRLQAEEEEQLRRVALVNDRVLRIIEACPDETLVMVLAGDCSVGEGASGGGGGGDAPPPFPAEVSDTTATSEGDAVAAAAAVRSRRRWVCHNHYSQAQGAGFFFVKDSAAPGPRAPPAAPAAAKQPVRDDGIDLNAPACRPQ